MRIVLTGATGFVGRALVLRLARDGHKLFALTRSTKSAASKVGADVTLVAIGNTDALDEIIRDADAIVNLAGESVAEGRWTEKRKHELTTSRIDTTRLLVDSIRRTSAKVQAFVSTSASGYYGDTGDREVDESAPPGDDFLAKLCVAWEAEAAKAEELGARVALMRLGVVLGDGGGALAKLIPLFKTGLGGKLGNGKQWVPWVHLHDVVEAFALALTDDRYRGPVNVVGPAAVTNAVLTGAIGDALDRPTVFTAPKFALKLALGGPASAVLASQRVVPAKLAALNFSYQFPTVESALAYATYAGKPVEIILAENPPDHPYLRKHKPTHVLSQRTRVQAPLNVVFPFFAAAPNLGAITPPDMAFAITTTTPLTMNDGLVIDYRITVSGVPMNWRTVIEEWRPGERFVDAQHKGPYKAWFHQHIFKADGDETIMEDHVWYALPFGPLGRMVHAMKVRSMLQRIFAYRTTRIALRFGHTKPAKQARATSSTLSASASTS
ncbi:MAG: TIGR01777 family protein [Clostridia bacterium]|nr:TIGR01777 family protein [Deltaproteobacteria bacterium]